MPNNNLGPVGSKGLSVLMAVYEKDRPAWVADCLNSLLSQTRQADEIVIVEDGTIPAPLRSTIEGFSQSLPLKIISKSTREGLGAALSLGLQHCRYSCVARMDADDECYPNRFERQLEFLNKHQDVGVVSAWISEVSELGKGSVRGLRRVPETHEEIIAYARYRNPINHMAVMFRRDAIISIGAYRSVIGYEDYDLWVRAIVAGIRFGNIQEPLVWARAGRGFVARRGGLRYLARELSALRSFHQIGFFCTRTLAINVMLRVAVRPAPEIVRRAAYRLLRAL